MKILEISCFKEILSEILPPVTPHQVPYNPTPHYPISLLCCFSSASTSFVLSKDCIPITTFYQHWKRVKITWSKPIIIQMVETKAQRGQVSPQKVPSSVEDPKENAVKYGFIPYCLLLSLLLREWCFLSKKGVRTIHPISFPNAFAVEDHAGSWSPTLTDLESHGEGKIQSPTAALRWLKLRAHGRPLQSSESLTWQAGAERVCVPGTTRSSLGHRTQTGPSRLCHQEP